MAKKVKLFGNWASPFSCRVEIALKMKGVEYEYIEENLSDKSDLLLQYNPIHKKIPVLLHNGKPICESVVILEYIEETWKSGGPPILPLDPYERAQARFWAKFLDDKGLALWTVCWSKDTEQEKAMDEATELLHTLETQLKDKKFFGGDNIGLVDIMANFIGFWFGILQEVAGIDLLTVEKFPLLCKWKDELVNSPFIKANLPPRDTLLGFFKAFPQPPAGPKYK